MTHLSDEIHEHTVNTLVVLAVDPGVNTGWAVIKVGIGAFSRPEHLIIPCIRSIEYGEITGTLVHQISQLKPILLSHTVAAIMAYRQHSVHCVTEAFNITQIKGGNELTMPLQINAVLEWLCVTGAYRCEFAVQPRAMRKQITKEVIEDIGYSRLKRNELSAVQHGLAYLRRLKQQSKQQPWKLSDGISTNALWDCACVDGDPCDLRHGR